MKNISKNTLSTFLVVVMVSGFFGYAAATFMPKGQNQLIKEFYAAENAVHVSPHHLRKHISDAEVVIVDLRSQEEYEAGHIIGALNVPAYKSPDKSAYGDVDRIVDSFHAISVANPDKDIVVYCYSAACMTGRKIGHMLSERGIYVRSLNIGWQEWRYYWDLWNHDGETLVNPEDYIHTGSEPGVFNGVEVEPCPVNGNFTC